MTWEEDFRRRLELGKHDPEVIHQLAAELRARIKADGLPQGPLAEDLIREGREEREAHLDSLIGNGPLRIPKWR